MARDIKHKAQSLKTGEWIIGYYVYLKDFFRKREVHRIYSGAADSLPDNSCPGGYDFCADYDDVDPDTLREYIGLRDRDGDPIFDGDILRAEGIKKDRYLLVSWNKNKHTWYIGQTAVEAFIIKDGCITEFELAGNTVDTPELLEEEK